MKLGGVVRVRRAIVRRRHWTTQLALALSLVAAAAGGRWLLDSGANGVQFATFMPVIVLAACFLDLFFAVLVAALSLIVVRVLFLDWQDPNLARMALVGIYLFASGCVIFLGQLMRATVIELDRLNQQSELLNRELQHRAKNALQIVSAMASQARRATSPVQFYEDLMGRISALVRANDYLGIISHRSGDLVRLVELSLSPFERSRIKIDGPPCMIDGQIGLRLMMVLHELGTNATKYGALSVPDGIVEVTWTVDESHASLEWRESGGPPVQAPARKGFGSRLLASGAPLSHARMSFQPSGVECSLKFRATAPGDELPPA